MRRWNWADLEQVWVGEGCGLHFVGNVVRGRGHLLRAMVWRLTWQQRGSWGTAEGPLWMLGLQFSKVPKA